MTALRAQLDAACARFAESVCALLRGLTVEELAGIAHRDLKPENVVQRDVKPANRNIRSRRRPSKPTKKARAARQCRKAVSNIPKNIPVPKTTKRHVAAPRSGASEQRVQEVHLVADPPAASVAPPAPVGPPDRPVRASAPPAAARVARRPRRPVTVVDVIDHELDVEEAAEARYQVEDRQGMVLSKHHAADAATHANNHGHRGKGLLVRRISDGHVISTKRVNDVIEREESPW